MSIATIDGISAETITTDRITTRVLFSGSAEGVPVLFLHGNSSSATWWEETMVSLPSGYRGIAPDQRGFGDAEVEKKIDATRGMGDLADDAIALLDHLSIDKAHIVGNSMGGSVIWELLISAPRRFLTATVVSPGSPYGFGGTKGLDGEPCHDDFSGSGGGLVNAQVVQLVKDGYDGLENPFGYRAALRTLVYKPPFIPEREDDLLASALSIHVGEQDWPGDKTMSPNWPHVAPGVWGAANGLSPKYAINVADLINCETKVRILWIRGSDDKAVADGAASDLAVLGAMGLVPGYPGAEVYPIQPMVSQTRAVLEQYGAFEEVVIDNTGHVPFIDDLAAFNAAFHPFISM
jgi:pimeloyl-ACP methyl ester carboxylesterase